ncbi:DUF389 domain-containing protein [Dyadobacter chenhuakuii]|uniref:DUF389 domain-containing protein n=1 Tax=Dyadobacter chenhuakuii TaxID=2909339 RepID=A0ABY4XQX1_9BACT|nr:DUF389 domain-containing protein [Dyadobacter chenhuakuii]MCF2492870.1 DUF389 domain-containing protein [Dyadobacter chenhuakuii]USJ32840.1 DUF389 domain-containing protein [Dyadobacter chenhuakuii]
MIIEKLLRRFDISSEREDYIKIHDTVESGIEFKGTNLWILIFAIFIASVGLNVNSTAVIIGAMLVSPLMGPILGMGYSIATYDFSLFRKALVNYLFAIVAGLLTSAIYFYVTPIYQAHSELLARTQPNIYDVIIALVGGLAGIVAISSKNKGNVIPGVAIATALMPPLCTAGYGLATANWGFFFGAFYLLTINTVFIGTATLITVRLLQYPIRDYANEHQKTMANRWVSFLVLLTTIPSIYYGYLLVQKEHFIQNANNFITNESYIEGDFLLKHELDPAKKQIKLIYGGKLINDSEKKRLNSRKAIYGLASTTVIVQQGFSINDVSGDLTQSDRYQAEINQLKTELSRNIQRQDSIGALNKATGLLFNEIKPLFPDVRYCSAERQTFFTNGGKTSNYTVVVLGSANLRQTGRDFTKIKNWLQVRLKSDSIKLYVEKAVP